MHSSGKLFFPLSRQVTNKFSTIYVFYIVLNTPSCMQEIVKKARLLDISIEFLMGYLQRDKPVSVYYASFYILDTGDSIV